VISRILLVVCSVVFPLCAWAAAPGADLAAGFADPPSWARPRVFWWWLQTTLSKPELTRDLEEMKRQGIGGALLWDGGSGPSAYGSGMLPLPPGPLVMSPEWREMIRHAVAEADRLGIELSLNMGTGPNCGGPWITLEHAAKMLAWSETTVKGPRRFSGDLPSAANAQRWASVPGLERVVARFSKQPVSLYREIAVLAGGPDRRWVDISARMDKNGRLEWDVPAGTWTVLRFGYVVTPQKLTYGSPGGNRDHGMFVDHYSAAAVDFQVRSFVEPLVRDAGEHAGRSLKYFHCDSWEIDSATWTPGLLDEFRTRRGYDPLLYLPALAGKTVVNEDVSERFRHDVRRTLADCLNDHHYARLLERCHQFGIGFHSESGGPHLFPVDSLSALARNDFPMGEFWIKAATHRTTDDTRLFIKPSASAAHLFGKRYAAMEALTSEGPQWEEDPQELKPIADRGFVEGANRLVLHTFTHSPDAAGKPGYEYLAGTHFNPNVTWWGQARAWTDYLARCQYMLTEGQFVADVLFFNGEQIPNYVERKKVYPDLGFGYDYDVANAEVILTRLAVKDGFITLPDGMRYRVLALPRQGPISVEVLSKMAELVRDGATLVGPPPTKSVGLLNYEANGRAVRELATAMWGATGSVHRYGKGRVVWGKPLREVLLADNVTPDFTYTGAGANPEIDYIHRRIGSADVYFVSNQCDRQEEIRATFRITAKNPELWDPATGRRRQQVVFESFPDTTTLPLRLPPYGSVFVVFRGAPPPDHLLTAPPEVEPRASRNALECLVWKAGRYELSRAGGHAARISVPDVPEPVKITGPWTVSFPKGWGAPESASFPKLISWTESADPGIRYFSGTAVYRTRFRLDRKLMDHHLELDLGRVRNLAKVKLNGRSLGVIWKEPWRVEIGQAVRAGENSLEIAVTNLWPNRLIGDAALPPEKRFTHTNVNKFKVGWPLRESGLIGPVRVVAAVVKPIK